jgi:hypothetical protein
MQLLKATRKKVKLRLGLSAVSGGGKTYSAILLAKGLVDGDLSKVAVIDTENNSASLYSHLGEYNTIELTSPYTPERYIQAIKVCEDAGMEVIIIDSITHEWDGKGGLLEIHSQMTGNSFTNWSSLTPRHQKFIDSILQSKCHVITTVRRKTEYDMQKDSNGRTKVEKSGLKEVTREGFEYELTINFNLDEKHNCTASKDRTGLFMDKPFFTITEETGKMIKQWCESGVEVPKPSITPQLFKKAIERINAGEIELIAKAKSTYSLTKEQLTELSNASNCFLKDKDERYNFNADING